jgi:transcriptional regulator with XRE-family HTH domain
MAVATQHAVDMDAIERLRERLHLGREDFARIIGVNPSTEWRWRQGLAVPRGLAQSRLVQFTELGTLLKRVFAGPDLAREWLTTARPATLGGRDTPLHVMREGRIDRVLATLDYLARGA